MSQKIFGQYFMTKKNMQKKRSEGSRRVTWLRLISPVTINKRDVHVYSFWMISMFIVKKKIEQEKLDKILLEEMDEETYNNLPFEKRKEIDDRLLETKKMRLKR